MTKSNKKNDKAFGFFNLLIISFPFFTFLAYLYFQYNLSKLELSIFCIAFIVPIALSITYFQKKMDSISREATLQLHDNKATKNSQLLLLNIMEKLPDPLLILDNDNRILMANKSAHNLLGSQILKQNISVFIRNVDLNNAIEAARNTGQTSSCELEFGNLKTIHYLIRLHLFNLTDNDHVPSEINGTNSKQYLFIALYDITALKRSDKMRADFVANASHELRTPLASILGFIETLQGPAKGDIEAHDRFLHIMYNEANRMGRLIEDLLSLSRIERDEHIPPSDKINIPHLIISVIKVLEPQAAAKNMTIDFSHDDLKEITGDYDQLTQVFQNIIENAIKYGNKDSIINVAANMNIFANQAMSKKTNITIVNEGVGIPAKHLPRLMERFYRVDAARSRSLGGTGLGLAIAKHIIQRHKGRIIFESEPNVATKVTVSLPI